MAKWNIHIERQCTSEYKLLRSKYEFLRSRHACDFLKASGTVLGLNGSVVGSSRPAFRFLDIAWVPETEQLSKIFSDTWPLHPFPNDPFLMTAESPLCLRTGQIHCTLYRVVFFQTMK